MATVSERYQKAYLSTPDFEQARVLTISRCVEMEVGTDESTDKKPVLFFQGVERGWPLNKTNWETISALTGQGDDDNWANYQIEIFKTQTQFGGKMVDCARVRAPGSVPQPQPSIMTSQVVRAEDIPF